MQHRGPSAVRRANGHGISPIRRPAFRAAVGTLVLAGWACTGEIAPMGGESHDGTGQGGGGALAGAGGRGGAAGQPAGTGGDTTPAMPSDFVTGPGVRRLTRTEYANTVEDLLGVTVARADLPKELIVGGHSMVAGAQKTGYEDTNAYLGIGEKAAAAAATRIAGEIKCADAACYKTWTQGFLLRAFRGPVPATVLDRYAAMLTATEAGETATDRVTTFLVAVLSSPHFLYRKEIGSGTGQTRKLTEYEIASRLSYLVWQSQPDATLLDAAGKGMLAQPAQRLAQLDRLLADDARVKKGLRAFVADWMGLFENHLPKKSAEVLMGTGTDFPTVAERSFDLLVDDVLGARATAKFSELLKVDYAYANATLAKIFGASSTPTDFQKVTLSSSERLGILTQPLVIAAHSKESGASPFPIGKFIFENVLCEVIPPPPAVFPSVEDTTNAEQTLRQRLEAMTLQGGCKSCHERIGPPGFAFLPFDPVGRYKNTDAKGRPYDTKGELKLAGARATTPFDGAADLAGKLAAQPSTQKCIARRLYRWTHGRFEGDGDDGTVSGIEGAAASSSAGVTELLRKIVESPSFGQVAVR